MNRLIATILTVFALMLLLSTPRAANAAESYDNCTGFITSLPTVINTEGTWCFKRDLATSMTSGNAITISTNNVTIDCNDFKLGGLAAGAGTSTIGIYANNRLNAAARHCNVRGFWIGIGFGGSGGGHTVEDNRLDGNTYTGVLATGDGSVVRRNLIFNTGGSPGSGAVGIAVNYAVDVLDNTVSGVTATGGSNGNAFGISTQISYGVSVVAGNRVRDLIADGSGQARGFSALLAQPVVLRGNDFVGNGSATSIGMSCFTSSGHAKDNVINGFATGISGCTDDGNVIAP